MVMHTLDEKKADPVDKGVDKIEEKDNPYNHVDKQNQKGSKMVPPKPSTYDIFSYKKHSMDYFTSRPPLETETGNSVNGSVPATCEAEGKVYQSDNEVKTDAESRSLRENVVDGPNSKEISSSLVPIDTIKIGRRFRKDLGDTASLAENIREIGLLQPIVINQNYELISGLRRIEAFKLLGRSEIPRFENNDQNDSVPIANLYLYNSFLHIRNSLDDDKRKKSILNYYQILLYLNF